MPPPQLPSTTSAAATTSHQVQMPVLAVIPPQPHPHTSSGAVQPAQTLLVTDQQQLQSLQQRHPNLQLYPVNHMTQITHAAMQQENSMPLHQYCPTSDYVQQAAYQQTSHVLQLQAMTPMGTQQWGLHGGSSPVAGVILINLTVNLRHS